MKPGTGSITARTLESAAFCALAFFLTVVLHEWAHGVAGWLLGGHPVVHTGFVEHSGDDGGLSQIAHTLAGPFFSLLQGFTVALVVAKLRSPARLRLFLLWLAYHGFVNFVGDRDHPTVFASSTSMSARSSAGAVFGA